MIVLACALASCAGRSVKSQRGAGPLRVSDVEGGGDPRRGASLWALGRGLDYASTGESARALIEYERAIQVDATNPYAYLALSRHYLERGDADRALRNLNQAELLFGLADEGAARGHGGADWELERIRPHLDGLRGGALLAAGREAEAQPLLERAREGAPEVWGDGNLTAGEFR